MSTPIRLVVIAASVVLVVGDGFAHAGARGHILLLPTGLYIVGGAVVVALSVLLSAVLPIRRLDVRERARDDIGPAPSVGTRGPSLVALCLLVVLVAAGYGASPDPLANPLPLVVWVLWWIGLSFVQAVFGDLWRVVNPLRGAYYVATLAGRSRRWRERAPFTYPARIGQAPAVLALLAFAWFELVHPSPQDPRVLANALVTYAAVTLAGMLVYGEASWLRHAEAFTVFFRIVAWLSPLDVGRAPGRGPRSGSLRVRLCVPGAKLVRVESLSVSGAAFVLGVLATVSFDGLSRTFWWLARLGVNPLEYPGRTALVGANTAGLLGTFALLSAAYVVAVVLGGWLCRRRDLAADNLHRLVLALVPIAFGYHFAHYLPAFLVESQYAVRSLSDPFDLGWNLLGTRDLVPRASLLGDAGYVRAIWYAQTGAIVAAHVVAVLVSHLLVIRRCANARVAALSQLPMNALMVGYTSFGLWLLSTPVAG